MSTAALPTTTPALRAAMAGGEVQVVVSNTADRGYLPDARDGPAALAVATSKGVIYFKPGVGRPATVTIRGGEASCVVGGWFRT